MNIFLYCIQKFYEKNKFIIKILAILFQFLIVGQIKSNLKICLCVIAKNENLYVREFVEYYKNLGYNNIYIYDNNDINGENFEEVINDFIQNGFVKIINFRNRNTSTRPIFDAYKDCYSRNNKKYNWLSFYDMDEFLELNDKYKTIQEFLNDKIFKICQNIKINWLMYINNKNLYYENKPLQKRITSFIYNDPANIHIKSTVKGNLPINFWEDAQNPHTPNLNFTSCSSSGKIISFNSPFNDPPDFTNAKLKHYYYKSFEEFCIKIKRGKCDITKNDSLKYINNLYNSLYLQNKNDTDKLRIINKIFNTSFNL